MLFDILLLIAKHSYGQWCFQRFFIGVAILEWHNKHHKFLAIAPPHGNIHDNFSSDSVAMPGFL